MQFEMSPQASRIVRIRRRSDGQNFELGTGAESSPGKVTLSCEQALALSDALRMMVDHTRSGA